MCWWTFKQHIDFPLHNPHSDQTIQLGPLLSSRWTTSVSSTSPALIPVNNFPIMNLMTIPLQIFTCSKYTVKAVSWLVSVLDLPQSPACLSCSITWRQRPITHGPEERIITARTQEDIVNISERFAISSLVLDTENFSEICHGGQKMPWRAKKQQQDWKQWKEIHLFSLCSDQKYNAA